MLSGESAMGSYGQKAISVLRTTSSRMELWNREVNQQIFLPQLRDSLPDQIAEQICNCAGQMGMLSVLICSTVSYFKGGKFYLFTHVQFQTGQMGQV